VKVFDMILTLLFKITPLRGSPSENITLFYRYTPGWSLLLRIQLQYAKQRKENYA